MFSSRSMLFIAQALLVAGAFSLVLASVRLFGRALEAGLPQWNLYWIVPVAVMIGVFKALVVMRKHMAANVVRLKGPERRFWLWQIYPSRLLIFILSMVVIMFVLKRVLAGNAVGLGILGGVDVLIGVALMVSSGEYRRG